MRLRAPWILLTGLAVACSGEERAPSSAAWEARSRTLSTLGLEARAPEVQVELARDARSMTRLRDAGVALGFALEGATQTKTTTRDGVTLFHGALAGADVIQLTRTDGVEDLVFFDCAPAREELTYTLDVSEVAGLRLVNNGLELLDSGGAPRWRVGRPWVADASGQHVDATLSVEGCAYDTNLAPPWQRPVTAPGTKNCRLRVSWSGVDYPAVVDPTWTTAGSLRSARHNHAMLTLESGKLLVTGGFHAVPSLGNGPAMISELFDPETRTWTDSFTLPNGREDLALAPGDDGRIVVVGGGSGRPDLYTPPSGIMRSMASGPGDAGVTATALPSGLVLVVGNTTGLFSAKNDEYTDTGVMEQPRTFHTATTLASGEVLFIGGEAGAPLASAELYDPAKNSFKATGAMTHARTRHVTVLLDDGRVFVTGGGDASAEIYDPKTRKFTLAEAMSSDRERAQGVLLESGHVLVAGGNLEGEPIETVDVFDPDTLTFASAAPLAIERAGFTATRLPTGETLVVAGKSPTSDSLSSVEVWLPNAPGNPCEAKDDCSTGVCQAGICCAEASCTGACQTCAAGDGACVAVTLADDPDSCTGKLTCDEKGACRQKNGQECEKAADCASGFCVDGFCCDSECGEQCQACDVKAKPGTCSAVVGDSHGDRPRCLAYGEDCGGECNGILTEACVFPSAVTECGAVCEDAKLAQSTCDGRGACIADSFRACAGNFACADEAACKTTCENDDDCAPDFHCDDQKCIPSAVCDGHVIRTGGRTTDCAPYNCEQSGACKESCSVVTDCAAPNMCDVDGRCVAPVLNRDIMACAIGAPARGSPIGLALVALGALLVGRRRRAA